MGGNFLLQCSLPEVKVLVPIPFFLFLFLISLPYDCKEIQPVHPKGDQSWVFTGRTDAEAETPVLWPPDVKS